MLLHLTHLIPAGTNLEIFSGPGSRNTGNLFCFIDVHIASIIITEDFYGAVILIPQIFGTPLAEPVGAGDSLAVAVLGQNGLFDIGPGKEIRKHLIHHPGNTGKIIPSVHPFVVIGGGGSDGEIIAFVPIQGNQQNPRILPWLFLT